MHATQGPPSPATHVVCPSPLVPPQVCITKTFLLPNQPHVDSVELCISSQDLHDRLKKATVHWLVVVERAEEAWCLPLQHYNMANCMEIERQYRDGRHVVELGSNPKRSQVNLDLMVEVLAPCPPLSRARAPPPPPGCVRTAVHRRRRGGTPP